MLYAVLPGDFAEVRVSERVTVFESNDRLAIALAKASLEDAGIPFWTHGDETGDETSARLVLGPIMFPVCRFLVPREHEAEARQLLETLHLGSEAN
jgi:hypothetical protein